MNAVDIDPGALRRFLDARFGRSPVLRLERIAGGQSNPTYCVDHGDRRMVLRKKPAGTILKGAHAVDREFRVLSALAQTDVPVPRPILLCEEAEPIGTPFYLMERLEGRVFHNAALPGLTPPERRAVYFAAAATLARLHAVEPEQVGLAGFGPPGDYFQRQLRRWSRQWRESPTADIPDLDALVVWLEDNLPADDGRVAIAHGDFRLGNLMFHPQEPRVIAVLDWELSTLGHPLADLGFACMAWHTAPDEYGGIGGLDHEALGIPAKAAFVEHYFAHAAPTAPLRPFHIVFGLFRFAVIFVGIADRAMAGSASGENAAALAPLARKFAGRGLDLARGHG